MKTNRRDFLKISGAGMATTVLPSMLTASTNASVKEISEISFRLGVASYSFQKFSVDDALAMAKRLGVHDISLKSFHLKLDASDVEIAETVKKCKELGIKPYGGGVIYMKSQAEVDQAFEYARKAGMDIIIGVPNHELLPYVEKKVKQYNIKLAIHNHGPGDKNYPSAESVYERVKNLDPRMGLCLDIGHTKRIGRDPSKDFSDFFDRIFDVHIKDETEATDKGRTCEIGRGVIDFPKFLKTVIKKKYSGVLALEFEKDSDDPLPGMAESLGYVRGMLTMLG